MREKAKIGGNSAPLNISETSKWFFEKTHVLCWCCSKMFRCKAREYRGVMPTFS
jgi:hypothetical protein